MDLDIAQHAIDAVAAELGVAAVDADAFYAPIAINASANELASRAGADAGATNALSPNVFSGRGIANPMKLMNKEAESHGVDEDLSQAKDLS